MFRKSILTRMMSGVAVAGAALLMTSPSASALHPHLHAGEHKKSECFVTGTLTVANLDIDVQVLVAFSDLAAGVEANITLFCSTPLRSDVTAIVFLNTENNLIVPLELVYPGTDALFERAFALYGHASKAGPHKFGHKATDDIGFVYQGSAGLTIETGDDPFELEARTGALLAQDTVLVKADGTTGTLEVRGALVQGVVGAP